MIGSQEIYGVRASSSYSQPSTPEEEKKVKEAEQKIERLRTLLTRSDHPEDQLQAIAILNFQLRRFTEALRYVAEAEIKAESPKRIYLSILLRARYYASEHLYSKAMQDLNQLNGMTDLPESKVVEIKQLINVIKQATSKDVDGETAKNLVPRFTFHSSCGETASVYRTRERAFREMESSMAALAEDPETAAKSLQERFRGDKEALIDHLAQREVSTGDGSTLYYQGQFLAKEGARLLQSGRKDQGETTLLKALDCFDRVLDLDEHQISEKNPDLWYFRSLVHAQLGHYEEALRDTNRAIVLSPREEKYYIFRATLLEELGNASGLLENQRAREDLPSSIVEEGMRRLDSVNQAIFLSGKTPDLLLQKAEYLHMLGEVAESAATARELLLLIDQSHPSFAKAEALARSV
ncbi:tetratricopeptide repeat protein [Estrella lausannensis]|uniref:Uncharacterized protein n=1 Tax=Estrella lausannensis TaxID=483423 RepID=A0A0H5DNJ4_9BACT|nr:tetratricopeptide repeat protein [Estrella lausannensis]CRX37797.1 hypothetical protein ELAC_0441 [Estrella lausannensis]